MQATAIASLYDDILEQLSCNQYALPLPFDIVSSVVYTNARRTAILLFEDILIKEVLLKHPEKIPDRASLERLLNIAIRIEQSCYSAVIAKVVLTDIIKFDRVYQATIIRVQQNLDETSVVKSSYMIDQIFKEEGILNATDCVTSSSTGSSSTGSSADDAPHIPYADRLGSMLSIHLAPEKSLDIVEEINGRMSKEIVKRISTSNTCYKCGQKKTTITQVALRRADEQTLYVIECVECGNRWVI